MKAIASLLSALALCLMLAASALAAEFSADLVQSMNGSPMMNGKIYVQGDRMRTDTDMGGMNAAMLTDLQARKVVMLQPQARTYMEMQFDPSRAGAAALKDNASEYGTWRAVGRETVDGWDCEKRVFDYKDKTKGELTAWFADKLGYPIKTVYKGEQGVMTMEYKNIKTGKVDASLFDIPAGYQKMSIPGMGQMGQQGMRPGMGQQGMRPGMPPQGMPPQGMRPGDDE